MRIDKFLSNLKYGSRKEIKELLKTKAVNVNNLVITNEKYKIDTNNPNVYINGVKVFYKSEINLIINKPVGYLSANSDTLHKVVFELIKEPYNRFDLKIAGRLDLDSKGLLILTNSGILAHYVTSPNSNISKVYEVILRDSIINGGLLLEGVIIKDGKNNEYLAKALNINIIEDKKLLITINEGKFHQVRRMFEYLGNEVLELKRIQIGNLKLDDLEEGKYKEFERSEL